MAFVKITQLPQTNTITSDDLFVIVDDPATNPVTKKIQVSDLLPFLQGPAGPPGPTGPTGAGITVLGVVANPSFLPLSGTTVGDAYIDTSTGDLYVWDGSVWQNAGPAAIPGPQGPSGSGVIVGGSAYEALVKVDSVDYNVQWVLLVPPGGTANQVLAKIDATDYNSQWVTPRAVDDVDHIIAASVFA